MLPAAYVDFLLQIRAQNFKQCSQKDFLSLASTMDDYG